MRCFGFYVGGQGRDNAKAFLAEHPELALQIEEKVRASITSGAASKVAAVTAPEAGEDEGDEPED